MIGKEDVALVRNQVEKGRGLWLGLFVNPSQMQEHPFYPMLPEDAHITLAHLGKRFPSEGVEELCRALDRLSSWGWNFERSEMPAEITGFGKLWRASGSHTQILLVNSAQVCTLRAQLLTVLADLGHVLDDAYGFIPHLTVRPSAFSSNAVRSQRVTFKTLHLVCGEAKVAVS